MSAPLAKSRLGVTETVMLPVPDCGAFVIVTFRTAETEVPEILALIFTEPAVVAVNTVAAMPLASVVAEAGVKFPELAGDTVKLIKAFETGVVPNMTVASTIAVELVWTVEGLTITNIEFPDWPELLTVLLVQLPNDRIIAIERKPPVITVELIRRPVSMPEFLTGVFIIIEN
ncbi:MAG: hypothetical protein ACREBV_01995 [Candidatus Zixiibacteriota bacterium]